MLASHETFLRIVYELIASHEVFLRGLFVRDVQEADAGQSADEEDDVEPAVVEVELQLPQHLRNYRPE